MLNLLPKVTVYGIDGGLETGEKGKHDISFSFWNMIYLHGKIKFYISLAHLSTKWLRWFIVQYLAYGVKFWHCVHFRGHLFMMHGQNDCLVNSDYFETGSCRVNEYVTRWNNWIISYKPWVQCIGHTLA